jgi:mono/diheme cytochrome c family protein
VRWLRFGALALTSVALVGCVTIKETVPPVATLAVRGKNTGQLETGRSLYLQKCAGCHVAATVREHPASDWPDIIGIMSKKAKLSPADKQAVLAYVLAASR